MKDDGISEYLAKGYQDWITPDRAEFIVGREKRWAAFLQSDLVQEMWEESEARVWRGCEDAIKKLLWPEERARLIKMWKESHP